MMVKLILVVQALVWLRPAWGAELQGQGDERSLRADLKADIPNTLLLPLNFSYINSSETLNLTAGFVHNETAGDQPWVQITILYENQTLETHLSNLDRTSSVLFCFSAENLADNLVVVARTSKETSIRLFLQVKNIELTFDDPKKVTISSSSSVTFLINPVTVMSASRNDRYVLTVESSMETKNVCMIVAAYANECPFKNKENNVRQADMWFTALDRGSMTIRYEKFKFNVPFYVSVVVLSSDADCHLSDYEGSEEVNRRKDVVLTIRKAKPYKEYTIAIVIAFIISVLLIVTAFVAMSTKKLNPVDEEDASVYYSPNGSREEIEIVKPSKKNHGNLEPDPPNTDVVDNGEGCENPESLQPMVVGDQTPKQPGYDKLKLKCKEAIPDASTRTNRIKNGLERLNPDAKLVTMTKILEYDVWFRRNRSRVYCYLVPLLSLFYFIPAIQFVFLVKETESMTGSQDLCFHNFECAKPLNIFSDFNHIVSNMSFLCYGLAFLAIVAYKARRLPSEQKPKNDHLSGKGILQQLSIFYAMGFALFFQGLFSICYHVCPTNHSLQFDTTMMYVMCMLGIVKIYQFRHPDANANAYSFFYFLACIVLLEALALYSTSWWVYGTFILLYVAMTIFIAIDCYFMGVGRLENKIAWVLMEEIFTSWRRTPNETNFFKKFDIKYPRRFGFAMLFCLVNFVHAISIGVSKWYDPKKTVTHVVLMILAINLFIYILYYVFCKNVYRFKNFYMACTSEDNVDARYQVEILNKQIPCPCSAGIFFALAALVLGVIAGYFYYYRNANRNLSPAESRSLNEACNYLDFYDNHDMWHFTGAAAIFMAFLALLTVDDDLLNVPRDQIDVF